MRNSLFILLCILLCSLGHAALIPVEELSHEAAFKGFTLSPDGKALAYSETVQGKNILRILDLETGKKVGLNLTWTKKGWSSQAYVFWMNDERLAYSGGGGYQAINRDGSNNRGLGSSGFLGEESNFTIGTLLHNYRQENEGNLLVHTYDISVNDGTTSTHYTYDHWRPGLAKLNGNSGTIILAEINPGNIVTWLVTSRGKVNVAQEIDGTRYRVVHRKFKKADWRALPGMDWDDPQVLPLGFGEDDQVLYVSRLNEHGRWAVYPYDLISYEFGPVILENRTYDIIPQTDASGQTGLIYSPDQKQLLGINYLTAYPRVYWLDQGLAEVQAGLDQALKGKVNSIVSMSDDLQKLIILSWSDRYPGTYYLFDREKQSLSLLMKSTPWIKEEQMAKMRPLKFKARDGVTIHGYMSLPVGEKPRNLPLIVLNNGDFWARGTWYFDRTVQYFANRGYAVLRINTRATTGYGDAFKRLGYGKTEESIADLVDGVKWAISKGLVNAKRVAIVGEDPWSGIRTLSAVAQHPDVFACGVVNSPYTDWRKVIHRDTFVRDYLERLRERIGDPTKPEDPISRRSPVQMIDQIKAPVLITETAFGLKPDHYTEIKKFVKALKKSGSSVEFKTKYKEKYGFQNYGKWLEDAEAFMAKHMPADG